jgi:acyl carrier protein
MADGSASPRGARISSVVQTILARRSIRSAVAPLQDLRDAGLTSLDLVNLMLAVEAEFDIEIPQADMTPENFRSIETIEQLVTVLAPAA